MKSPETSLSQLTPQTFANAFACRKTRVTEAHLFQSIGPLYLCREASFLFSNCRNVWLIDGDDTLWEDNIHYEALADKFATHVIDCLGETQTTKAEIRKLLDEVEQEVIPRLGFGPVGFEHSIRKCFAQLKERFGKEIPEPTKLFERILPLLSGVPYEIDDGVAEALQALRARGDGLVLFTQGPCEIQQGKIARSGLASIFHALAVGSNKTEETYKDLLERLGTRIDQAMVVGNSLRSEVAPALSIGARAVHYLNPNSWHAVNTSSLSRDSYKEVHHLRELLAL